MTSDDSYFLSHKVPKCVHPIMVNGRLVPCGHCRLCHSEHKKDWLLRCKLESLYHRFGFFLTLTFRDDALYNTGYRTIQKFLKRLRKLYNLRYYGVFENGEKTYRPHYHMIVWSDDWIDDFERFWPYGFVESRLVDDKSIAYVVGYCSKKLGVHSIRYDESVPVQRRRKLRHDNKYDDKRLIRSFYGFMSKGIGFDYYRQHCERILRDGFIAFNQVRYRIPHSFVYWVKKYRPDLADALNNSDYINIDYKLLSNEVGQKDADLIYFNDEIAKNKQKVRLLNVKKKMCKSNGLD